ncbi:rz protein [Escherichia coli STEC_94C]|nr:rz protein [Escherichia coli STEC_94C]
MLSAFTVILLVVCGALSLGLNHYRDNAITYKAQRDKKPESWSRQTQPLLICRCAARCCCARCKILEGISRCES